ncbi:MAG: hypothetical protein GY938_30615 [Ketobacter sp.]|nr:hypothetical protein [Ketobacter sp.]
MICLVLGVYLVGCESTVMSPVNPERKVTRVELDAELEHMATLAEIAYADLERQDAFKQKLFEIGLVAAQGGTINPVGAGVTLLGILGIGAVADNRKKDSIIKTLQKKEA